MNYTIRKNDFDVISFHISKSGKTYWKPVIETHRESMAKLRYKGAEETSEAIYEAKHYFVISCVQLFWLRWIFAVDIHKQYLSDSEVMNYKDTINHELKYVFPDQRQP